jgi:glucose/arabinose dehydrogenase
MRLTPLLLLTLLAGCFSLRGSSGGGQIKPPAPATTRPVNVADIALPAGYRIDVVATGLTFPTGVTFDDEDRPCVVEAGYAYGEVFTTPRLVRIEPDGRTTEIAHGSDNGPWTGVTYYKGYFYVAEGGVRRGGAILRISPDGRITRLVEGLPTKGDHHTNAPVVSPDGAYLYFGVGSATNSGVVGLDNGDFGWLDRDPEFHDIPARDIKLTGQNFVTRNPLTPDRDADATTGAFVPFGTATQAGHVVKGEMPCNGAILRIPLPGEKNTKMEDGRWRMEKSKTQYASTRRDPPPSSILHPPSSSPSSPQLVAWGLRNPFALAFAPDGRLFCAENSYDVRGSRPVYGTGDVLWQVATDKPLWYGFPDFHAGRPLTWSDHFQAPGQPAPQFLLAEHPNPVPRPAAILPVHGSYCGFDFSRTSVPGGFGFPGNLFIAAFGDMAPAVGKVLAPVGFRVDRVDPNAGVIESFAVNRGKENGPASKLKTGGLERPIAARFDNNNTALYVVDFGVLTMDGKTPKPLEKTGVLWRITREGVR